MQDHRTITDPEQLSLLPAPAADPANGRTFWAWRVDPKRLAMDNLLYAKTYRRQHYGDKIVVVHCRSELAEMFSVASDIAVVADDRVPAATLYCVTEVRST